MRTIKITLDGQECEVQERRAQENAAWRQKLNLPDTVESRVELLVDYAPDLAAPLENAYDSEIVEAFKEVLRLADPLAQGAGPRQPPTTPSSPLSTE
jgi:hypothetical protein